MSLHRLLLIGLAIFLAGCSKITQENYDKLKVGETTYAETLSILGDPDNCDSVLNAKSCTWGKEPSVINVKFVADKIVLRSGKGLD